MAIQNLALRRFECLSVFAGTKDSRRESKANKRREELEKTIKMVSVEECLRRHRAKLVTGSR
jgi:hypothetical protein